MKREPDPQFFNLEAVAPYIPGLNLDVNNIAKGFKIDDLRPDNFNVGVVPGSGGDATYY